jgi:hypothetical protein
VLEIKCPEKNLGWRACTRGFNLGVKGLMMWIGTALPSLLPTQNVFHFMHSYKVMPHFVADDLGKHFHLMFGKYDTNIKCSTLAYCLASCDYCF